MKRSARRNRGRNKLVVYPDKVLTQEAVQVIEFNKDVRDLINDMFHICRNNRVRGAGLGANQVGVLKRVVVINVDDMKCYMINPEILQFSETRETAEEGCLSHPGMSVAIERSTSIVVRYQDMSEHWHELPISGLVSRIVQHEVDHLNGKNVIDYKVVK